MHLGRLRFFPPVCMLVACAQAEPRQGNALALLDAYLAHAALEWPAYRTDLEQGGDPRNVAPGRLLGFSPTLGPFTYRPRTYDKLSPGERAALMHDPRFRAFLIATCRQTDRPAIELISISPEEMLRSGPVFITLPAPPGAP
jgi:hypothetical protein